MGQEIDLVISGGSVEGLCTATGFLKAVVKDLGHTVIQAAGNSAGAVVLGCHASGMSPEDIEKIILEEDFTKYVSIPAWWNLWKWYKFKRNGWLSNGKAFQDLLIKVTGGKTFKEAAFDLRLVGAEISRYRMGVFSKETEPEMPLGVAMRISASLPVAFSPVEWKGEAWQDGGIYRHYPCDQLPGSDRPYFGWLLGSTSDLDVKVDLRPGIFGTAMDYIDHAVDANVEAAIRFAPKKPLTVEYNDTYVGTLDFDISRSEKERLIGVAHQMTLDRLKEST